jgi:hypothetical protein
MFKDSRLFWTDLQAGADPVVSVHLTLRQFRPTGQSVLFPQRHTLSRRLNQALADN